jgi:hypothetical protein
MSRTGAVAKTFKPTWRGSFGIDRKSKRGVFLLEWLNIYAIAYYFNFLFFLTREHYGFTSRDNLLLAALNGFFYIFSSWLGGLCGFKHLSSRRPALLDGGLLLHLAQPGSPGE